MMGNIFKFIKENRRAIEKFGSGTFFLSSLIILPVLFMLTATLLGVLSKSHTEAMLATLILFGPVFAIFFTFFVVFGIFFSLLALSKKNIITIVLFFLMALLFYAIANSTEWPWSIILNITKAFPLQALDILLFLYFLSTFFVFKKTLKK